MSREWSRGERKEHLKERYRNKKEKFFSLVFLAIVFLALISLLAYGISVQADIFLLIILVIIILILIPIAVFFTDVIHWEP